MENMKKLQYHYQCYIKNVRKHMKKIAKSTQPYKVGLDDYFSRPVPILSENNVDFICKNIDDSYDYFIEYGLGSSTLYFLDKFRNYNLTFISVENTINWFAAVIKYLEAKFDFLDPINKVTYFEIKEIYSFAKKLNTENPSVPHSLSRRKRWKEALLLGPLYRFSPQANSRFSGIIPFWQLSRLPMMVFSFIIYSFFPRFRPARGEFRGG